MGRPRQTRHRDAHDADRRRLDAVASVVIAPDGAALASVAHGAIGVAAVDVELDAATALPASRRPPERSRLDAAAGAR
jgi:hypothetical protein